MILLSFTITQPALPLSQVARLETASHKSKKYLSQSGRLQPIMLHLQFSAIHLQGNKIKQFLKTQESKQKA
jgi:hypothetical protein